MSIRTCVYACIFTFSLDLVYSMISQIEYRPEHTWLYHLLGKKMDFIRLWNTATDDIKVHRLTSSTPSTPSDFLEIIIDHSSRSICALQSTWKLQQVVGKPIIDICIGSQPDFKRHPDPRTFRGVSFLQVGNRWMLWVAQVFVTLEFLDQAEIYKYGNVGLTGHFSNQPNRAILMHEYSRVCNDSLIFYWWR